MAADDWAQWLREQLDERRWETSDLVHYGRGQITRAQTSKWLKGQHIPGIESVRAVCDALGLPVVQGLLAADLLEPKDVDVTVVERPLRLDQVHHRALLRELARRLDEAVGEAGADEDEPPVDAPEQPESPEARPARIYGHLAGEDVAARRRDRA